MKTTILTKTSARQKRGGAKSLPNIIINLFLAINYLIVVASLISVPGRHGYGGGTGITLSLPSFLILFSVLIIVHLVLIFQSYLPDRILRIFGFILIISGAMTLSLLLFSRQSLNLLQIVYPVPMLVFGFLALSLLLGLYIVTKRFTPIYLDKVGFSDDSPGFPFPKGRYRNVRIINEGGVGTIWYAERIADNSPVAVKVPKNSDEQTGMSFMQEISLWKDLNHPNIVAILSANILPVPYIEMEYLPDSLATIEKPVAISRAVEIFDNLVSALIYAHNQGIIHCDIKPTNILLTCAGLPKLTDWGLSRSGSTRWAVSGFSPRYAAPEQRGMPPECSSATDVWQIGMILTELITGKAELPAGSETVFLQSEGGNILPIILRCLASDPADRYPSAQAIRDDLEKIQGIPLF